MKLNFLKSRRLTNILSLFLIALVIVNVTIIAKERRQWEEVKKGATAMAQATALAHAISQFCKDFPGTAHVSNNREWTQLLAGQNVKKIAYLKVDKYLRDSLDRLLDPCGVPYVIEQQGTPGFVPIELGRAVSEFHVRSEGCREGFAVGYKTTAGCFSLESQRVVLFRTGTVQTRRSALLGITISNRLPEVEKQ